MLEDADKSWIYQFIALFAAGSPTAASVLLSCFIFVLFFSSFLLSLFLLSSFSPSSLLFLFSFPTTYFHFGTKRDGINITTITAIALAHLSVYQQPKRQQPR
jgi:hypothetical protein